MTERQNQFNKFIQRQLNILSLIDADYMKIYTSINSAFGRTYLRINVSYFVDDDDVWLYHKDSYYSIRLYDYVYITDKIDYETKDDTIINNAVTLVENLINAIRLQFFHVDIYNYCFKKMILSYECLQDNIEEDIDKISHDNDCYLHPINKNLNDDTKALLRQQYGIRTKEDKIKMYERLDSFWIENDIEV